MPKTALPYYDWEDYKAGLYRMATMAGEPDKSAALLSDPEALYVAMVNAIDAWPNSALHQLSNTEQNRRAWLGWAACMVAHGSCALATRAAWNTLTDAQRTAANAAADRAILGWERVYEQMRTEYQGTLFGFEDGMTDA